MERSQFTFYESFAKAIKRIRKKADRADAYDAIVDYALYGIEPDVDAMSDAVAIAFELIKPNLDSARKMSKGGRKAEQRSAKGNSKVKQRYVEGIDNESEKEIEVENEVEKEIEVEKEKEIESENERSKLNIICAEPKIASAPPVIVLPLNDGSEYPVSAEQVAEWTGLYPAVDVIQQLRAMRGWLIANPLNRKTKTGVLRFVNSWLAKEQNRGGSTAQTAQRAKQPGEYKGADFWD